MKKILCVLMSCVMLLSLCSVTAMASEPEDVLVSRSVETLENGDQVVTELYEDAIQPYAGIKGHKTKTYYNSQGTAIWSVTVNGLFTYVYAVRSEATYAEAVVTLMNDRADFISKDAYVSGNTATAVGTIAYDLVSTTMKVSVSCDIYGNLH